MAMNELIGKRIAQLRKKNEISQQKFAHEADIERSYLTHVEKGRKNISVNTLDKIIKALGVSVNEFFNHKDFK